MELYIEDELIAEKASVADLETAMKTVWAGHGEKDLCLAPERGPQLFLSVMPPIPTIPESFLVELVGETFEESRFFDRRLDAANAARRFLAGRSPFPRIPGDDDCPLCRISGF